MSEPRTPSAHVDTFAADNLPPKSAWPPMSYDVLPELAAYPARMNCATELLDKQAAKFGERPAYWYGSERWTYNDLLETSNRIANVLTEDLGVRPGNRVMLRAPNNPLYVASWFAVTKVGAIAVATMPLLRWRELTFMADKARIELALCDKRLDEEMERTLKNSSTLKRVVYFYAEADDPMGLESLMARRSTEFTNVDTAADDVCLVAFTSGTTGEPKGCVHFHRDVLAICDTFSRHVLRPGPEDIFAGSPPIAFTFGLGALVTFPMHAGAATLLVEQFTPEVMLKAIERYHVTTLFAVPTVYRAMVDLVKDFDIASLNKCVSAGETLPKPTFEAWETATGIRIIDGIGSTEMLSIFIAGAGDDIRPGATGKPIPGYKATVVDDAGNPVSPGTVGRLAVRGPTGCRYLADPERQLAYVQNGWNVTGDAYMTDEDGYFWYQARADDLIVSAGYNIAGPEVEAVLLEHPKVLECAVVGVPDPQRGQIVKAFVVLREERDAGDETVKEFQEFVKAEIAPYKYPRAIEFVDALPRTPTGKVQRFVLRQREQEKAGTATESEDRPGN